MQTGRAMGGGWGGAGWAPASQQQPLASAWRPAGLRAPQRCLPGSPRSPLRPGRPGRPGFPAAPSFPLGARHTSSATPEDRDTASTQTSSHNLGVMMSLSRHRQDLGSLEVAHSSHTRHTPALPAGCVYTGAFDSTQESPSPRRKLTPDTHGLGAATWLHPWAHSAAVHTP